MRRCREWLEAQRFALAWGGRARLRAARNLVNVFASGWDALELSRKGRAAVRHCQEREGRATLSSETKGENPAHWQALFYSAVLIVSTGFIY